MQMLLKAYIWMTKRINLLKIIYTMCFVALCIINWVKVSLNGRAQMTAANLTALVISVLILSNYKFKDFCRRSFGVWVVGCALLFPKMLQVVEKAFPYWGVAFTTCINYFISGVFAILFFSKSRWKEVGKTIRKNILVVWLLLIFLMIISINEDIWPLWFGIIMLSYYFSPFSMENRKLLMHSLIDGVILGFFIIQGAALLFRPYDLVRYQGLFTNPNMNALFYSFSYAAFLCKWYYFIKEKKSIFIRTFCCGMSCSLIGFCILTGSKAALFSMICETLLFSYLLFHQRKYYVLYIARFLIILMILGIVFVPINYLAIRYIPTLHLHPLYFEGEYSESKVLPGEPRDSVKYISFDETISCSFGRLLYMFELSEDLSSHLGLSLVVHAADNEVQEPDYLYSLDEIADGFEPIDFRLRIYRSYIQRLNLWGHSNTYEPVIICEGGGNIPHAHNIFIQMAFLYGVPVGLLFIILVVVYAYKVYTYIKSSEDEIACIVSCFAICFLVFGFFEIDWMLGQLPFTMFFLLFKEIIYNYGVKENTIKGIETE